MSSPREVFRTRLAANVFLVELEGVDYCGRLNATDGEGDTAGRVVIEIRADIDDEEKADTFFHELAHLVLAMKDYGELSAEDIAVTVAELGVQALWHYAPLARVATQSLVGGKERLLAELVKPPEPSKPRRPRRKTRRGDVSTDAHD